MPRDEAPLGAVIERLRAWFDALEQDLKAAKKAYKASRDNAAESYASLLEAILAEQRSAFVRLAQDTEEPFPDRLHRLQHLGGELKVLVTRLERVDGAMPPRSSPLVAAYVRLLSKLAKDVSAVFTPFRQLNYELLPVPSEDFVDYELDLQKHRFPALFIRIPTGFLDSPRNHILVAHELGHAVAAVRQEQVEATTREGARVARASAQLHIPPSQLHVEQLDAPLVIDFLNHLETVRGNGPSSRNVRLAAIKSFMHFLEFREPSALDQIRRILAIPLKKSETRLVRHLTVEEMQAILDAPAPATRDGLRDRAMLHLCFAGGLRVSELVGVRLADVTLQPHASIVVHGKGRRERCLPLWKVTVVALRAWLAVRGAVHTPELFVNARGQAMTRSGFEYILAKHVKAATTACPSLAAKHVSPHVIRHTCALTVLQATKDLRKVSLWLGHAHMQTTEMYTRADPSVKLEALEAMLAPKLRSGRFKATEELIASLTSRSVMRSAMASP